MRKTNSVYLAQFCHETWHIHGKMALLGNEVLQLELFQKPLDIAKLSEFFSVYQPTFDLMWHYKMKSSSGFDPENDNMDAIYYFLQSIPVRVCSYENTKRWQLFFFFHAVS